MPDTKECILYPTPQNWLEQAQQKENASMLLIYHANCKKTAFIALNLLVCYTELGDLPYKLSRLAHKELCYFEQLGSIIKKR